MKRQNRLNAFTIAEMLIVVLIISIVLALSLPIITSRMRNSSSNDKIWQWSANNTDIFFATQPTPTVFIGRTGASLLDPASRLSISTSNANQNHLVFKQGATYNGRLIVDSAHNVGLGDVSLPPAGKTHSIALGSGAEVTNTDGIAIGNGASVTDVLGIAIGKGALASASSSLAIGSSGGTLASGIGSTALGWDAKSTGGWSLAAGLGSNASADESTAVGNGSSASGLYSTALGRAAQAKADSDIAIGNGAIAGPGAYAISIGTNASASGSYPVAIGYQATDATDNSVAIGVASKTDGLHGIAVGSGAHSYAVETAMALGRSSKATGEWSVAVGPMTEAAGFSTTIGSGSKATGDGGSALGGESLSSGLYSLAVGSFAKATQEKSVALGVYAKSNNLRSTAIGAHAETTADYQIMIGTSADAVMVPGSMTVSGAFTNPSDYRLKNIKGPSLAGIDQIRKLKIFDYTFKSDKNKTPRVGVIAQDLQKVFPSAITKDAKGFLMIRQEDMFYAMVNSIKQIDMTVQGLVNEFKYIIVHIQKIDDKILSLMKINQLNSKNIQELKAENKELKQQNKSFEARLKRLERLVK